MNNYKIVGGVMVVTVAEENKLFRDLLSPDISSQEKIAVWQGMLDKGMKSTRTNTEGDSVLAIAAYIGDAALLEYALDIVKVDPNIQNRDGQTPLMLAAKEGNLAEINLLIERQADATMVDKDGDNALDYVQRHQSKSFNYISCYDAVKNGHDAVKDLKYLSQNPNLGSDNTYHSSRNDPYLNSSIESTSSNITRIASAENNSYLTHGAVGLVAATAALGVAKILSRVFKPTETKGVIKKPIVGTRELEGLGIVGKKDSPSKNTRSKNRGSH